MRPALWKEFPDSLGLQLAFDVEHVPQKALFPGIDGVRGVRPVSPAKYVYLRIAPESNSDPRPKSDAVDAALLAWISELQILRVTLDWLSC